MTNEKLISSIQSLLALDAKGALVPHGIGGLASELLTKSVTAIDALAQQLAASQARALDVQEERNHWQASATANGRLHEQAKATITRLESELAARGKRLAEAERLLRGLHTGDLFGPDDWETVESFLSPAEDKAND